MARPTFVPTFVEDARSLGHRVTRLVSILDPLREGTGVSDVLQEVRDLLQAFQAAEARNVRVALSDAAFPFTTVQECLGTLRRSFGSITRVAADGLEDRLSPEEREELLQIALLAQAAPLTTLEDIAAIRVARDARRTAVA